MIEWFAQVGLYLTIVGVVFLSGSGLALWGLFGDRSRGEARCPKCWYDMRGRRAGREGLVCPECGYDARKERRLYKDRRRWRAIVPGVALALVSGYPLAVVAGWYREQGAIEALEEKANDPQGAREFRTRAACSEDVISVAGSEAPSGGQRVHVRTRIRERPNNSLRIAAIDSHCGALLIDGPRQKRV